MKQTFAIIGLGRFGGSLLKKLASAHQDVLGIDCDEELVEDYMAFATHTAIADGQDEDALRALDIASFDHVIIAIGHNIQASILTTILVKDLGAKHIVAKAETTTHAKVLARIGADMIVHPEAEMGRRVAHQLMTPNILNYIDLTKDYSLAEIRITNTALANKSLSAIDFRNKYRLNVIAVRHSSDNIKITPQPDEVIHLDDVLSVIGKNRDVDAFDAENSD
ncbi:potassium channel family protein [Periweissella beninensis]|uniref:TrkA family potassium uptake protein n=1 Tax=Periweissella beninensis TaxID=504936 RepID=A0ABT0VHB4_9LACO|nr:TrkA family potassium uptake protein [Periweissella beninensis]MCM2437000.1 TrkA family potassium uptake protein [Periweissella beninensis]MCT4396360.1 TrkA family potassium uptake protein [Periweissella beninensis]